MKSYQASQRSPAHILLSTLSNLLDSYGKGERLGKWDSTDHQFSGRCFVAQGYYARERSMWAVCSTLRPLASSVCRPVLLEAENLRLSFCPYTGWTLGLLGDVCREWLRAWEIETTGFLTRCVSSCMYVQAIIFDLRVLFLHHHQQ